jgi:hypothetical protein
MMQRACWGAWLAALTDISFLKDALEENCRRCAAFRQFILFYSDIDGIKPKKQLNETRKNFKNNL